MPVVPVLPSVTGLDAWSLWKNGRVSAASVTWSADATDANAQQNYLLSQLGVNRGYNAIRLVLSAGSSDSAWDDMYKIATDPQGWDSSATLAPANGGQPISAIRDNIINILTKCEKLGMGVILDCHDFFQRDQSNGAVGPLWTGTWTRPAPNSATTLSANQLRSALVSFWTKTVQAFPASTYKAIIGYEILNEPNPDPSLTFAAMEAGNDNCWSKLATLCIKAIRALDLETPIVIDGIYYADPYGLKYFDPTLGGAGLLQDYLSDGATPKTAANRRLVYSFHVYGPLEFTHQGVSDLTYESQGIPYPLDAYPPYNGAPVNSSARMRATVNDGSAAWVSDSVNNPGGSTSRVLDLKFSLGTSAANLLARNQPALDFKTHASAAQGGVSVPVFVGEFSAIDTKLIKSNRIDASSPRRVITKIQVDSEGLATVTLGNLSGGFLINLYPQYDAPGSTAPGYNGAYSDYARATVTNSTDAAFDISYPLGVRIENGRNKIEPPFRLGGPSPGGSLVARRVLALYYTDPSMAGRTLGDGSSQVATLTISPGSYAAATLDNSRYNYVLDVLKMCLAQGFSWAYWQEDGYTANVANVNALPDGVFIAWRPNAQMSSLMTKAATRRTVA